MMEYKYIQIFLTLLLCCTLNEIFAKHVKLRMAPNEPEVDKNFVKITDKDAILSDDIKDIELLQLTITMRNNRRALLKIKYFSNDDLNKKLIHALKKFIHAFKSLKNDSSHEVVVYEDYNAGTHDPVDKTESILRQIISDKRTYINYPNNCPDYNENLLKLWSYLAPHLKVTDAPSSGDLHNIALIVQAYLEHQNDVTVTPDNKVFEEPQNIGENPIIKTINQINKIIANNRLIEPIKYMHESILNNLKSNYGNSSICDRTNEDNLHIAIDLAYKNYLKDVSCPNNNKKFGKIHRIHNKRRMKQKPLRIALNDFENTTNNFETENIVSDIVTQYNATNKVQRSKWSNIHSHEHHSKKSHKKHSKHSTLTSMDAHDRCEETALQNFFMAIRSLLEQFHNSSECKSEDTSSASQSYSQKNRFETYLLPHDAENNLYSSPQAINTYYNPTLHNDNDFKRHPGMQYDVSNKIKEPQLFANTNLHSIYTNLKNINEERIKHYKVSNSKLIVDNKKFKPNYSFTNAAQILKPEIITNDKSIISKANSKEKNINIEQKNMNRYNLNNVRFQRSPKDIQEELNNKVWLSYQTPEDTIFHHIHQDNDGIHISNAHHHHDAIHIGPPSDEDSDESDDDSNEDFE